MLSFPLLFLLAAATDAEIVVDVLMPLNLDDFLDEELLRVLLCGWLLVAVGALPVDDAMDTRRSPRC